MSLPNKRKSRIFNNAGLSLLEIVIGITLGAICFLSFLSVSSKIETGRFKNTSRTKAMSAAATVMQNIRSLAWDEWAVNNSTSTRGRGVYVSTFPVHNASAIGTEVGDPSGTYDDVDDYDGQSIIDGPFTSNVQVFYVNVPINNTPVTFAPNGGRGTLAADRTDFKLVIVSTTWQGGDNITLKTITANGR